MPAIKPDSFFSLADYFCSWGFGDGDDDVAKSKGLRWRRDAIQILNNHLQTARVYWQALPHDLQSLHNDVRIIIIDSRKRTVDIEISKTDEVITGNDFLFEAEERVYWANFKTVVWPRAFEDFENWILLNERGSQAEIRLPPIEPSELELERQFQNQLTQAAEDWAKTLVKKNTKAEVVARRKMEDAALNWYRLKRR